MYLYIIILGISVVCFNLFNTWESEAIGWWSKNTHKLAQELRSMWYTKDDAENMINSCKTKANDPRHCVIHMASIWCSETSCWKSRNMFWVTGYTGTKQQAPQDWVNRYVKWWYKANGDKFFYSNTPVIKPKTRYCMSEESSNSKWFCPNGYKHYNKARRTLQKLP